MFLGKVRKISYDILLTLGVSYIFMARKSIIARNEKRIRMSEKYSQKRLELKAKGDWEGLQKLPKNSSPVRIKNRCFITGRGRGYMRAFGMSRHCFREQALKGYIPGIKKSSW